MVYGLFESLRISTKLWFMVRLLKQTGKRTEMRNECSEQSRLNTWNSGIFNQIIKSQHYSHHILQMNMKNKINTENCTLTEIYTLVKLVLLLLSMGHTD